MSRLVAEFKRVAGRGALGGDQASEEVAGTVLFLLPFLTLLLIDTTLASLHTF
jgi:hypothetical protein